MDALAKEQLLENLQKGEMSLQGQFVLGSNATLFVSIKSPTKPIHAVYKPERGERPLWDFPHRSLEKREVAAFLVSEALGWELVPPVVYRLDAPFGPGSVQVFIEHDPNYHFFNFSEEDIARLRPTAVFDLLVNNADRKGGHIIKDAEGHIWLIDHGLCFHQQAKLRTVLWDFAGEDIPAGLLKDLEHFSQALQTDFTLQGKLMELLLPEEIQALFVRTQRLLREPLFPYPDEQTRQFPFPPL